MVPLGRELVSFLRLSVQTTLVSGTVWPLFAMQVLTGDCPLQVWEKGWSYRVGVWHYMVQLKPFECGLLSPLTLCTVVSVEFSAQVRMCLTLKHQ